MNRKLAPVLLLALTAALGACSKEPDTTGTASGEILPGSISDAMLPEDRVTSQPPLDPRVQRTGSTTRDDDKPDGSPAASGTPEPTPTPETTASGAAQ